MIYLSFALALELPGLSRPGSAHEGGRVDAPEGYGRIRGNGQPGHSAAEATRGARAGQKVRAYPEGGQVGAGLADRPRQLREPPRQ